MKKIIVLLVVLLLFALTVQVAFADPAPPNVPPTGGSCHMVASWWEPLPYGGPAPGNANGVEDMTAIDYYLIDENGNIKGDPVVDPDTGDPIGPVQQRGMAMAHYNQANPEWPTPGAYHMDEITTAHCGG